MYFVYILRCADRSLYVGQTRNLGERIELHNAGRGPDYTARRRPVILAYLEMHETRPAAATRERQLKRWTRRKKEGANRVPLPDCPAAARGVFVMWLAVIRFMKIRTVSHLAPAEYARAEAGKCRRCPPAVYTRRVKYENLELRISSRGV